MIFLVIGLGAGEYTYEGTHRYHGVAIVRVEGGLITHWREYQHMVCGNLFDRSPLAWRKIRPWAARDEEYVRRAAFALIASLAVHDREAPDARFQALLPLIAAAATDERNFVKKAVNWALRNIGKRNRRLRRAALATARRLRAVDSRAARWVAADAIRELESEAVQERLRRR